MFFAHLTLRKKKKNDSLSVLPRFSIHAKLLLFSYFAHRVRHTHPAHKTRSSFSDKMLMNWWSWSNLLPPLVLRLYVLVHGSGAFGGIVCHTASPVKTMKQNFHFIIFPLRCISCTQRENAEETKNAIAAWWVSRWAEAGKKRAQTRPATGQSGKSYSSFVVAFHLAYSVKFSLELSVWQEIFLQSKAYQEEEEKKPKRKYFKTNFLVFFLLQHDFAAEKTTRSAKIRNICCARARVSVCVREKWTKNNCVECRRQQWN